MANMVRMLRRALFSRETISAGSLVLALAVLLAPLPGFGLDVLLAISVSIGLAALLVAALAEEPVQLGYFPSLLVTTCLLRVGLCLAITRAVLVTGDAGALVQTLGAQLTGSGASPVTGIAVVAILAIVIFVVINNGVVRLAEVAARFALDALPGRQMAIDGALSRGHLEVEAGLAESRRLEVESSFYGAMDGVARFLRGEAIATVVIVAITPVAAAVSGATGGNTGMGELIGAAVGQGSLILVPGILTGAAAALILSRAGLRAGKTSMVEDFVLRPAIPAALALALLALGLLPGLAHWPLLAMAAVATGGAVYCQRQRIQNEASFTQPEVPVLQLRLGLGLMALAAQHDLLGLLRSVRATLADELGFAIPTFDVRDDGTMADDAFGVFLGAECLCESTLKVGRRLVVPLTEGVLPAGGVETVLPDGCPATWLREPEEFLDRDHAYHSIAPPQVLTLYVEEAVRGHAAELFDVQRAAELIQAVRMTHPAAVGALEQAGVGALEVAAVGQVLLAEGVPLTDRVCLLEALTREAQPGMGAAQMAELIRPALARTLTRLLAPGGVVEVIELGRNLNQELATAIGEPDWPQPVALTPDRLIAWEEALHWLQERFALPQRRPVMLCGREARPVLAQIIRDTGLCLYALQPAELLPLTEVQTVYMLSSLEPEDLAVPLTRE